MIQARLHPIWRGEGTARLLGHSDGKLLVERSRDPEHDAARALVAKGITTGELTLCNGKTGKPRTIIDIEKAAKLMTTEESRGGLRKRRLHTDNSPYIRN
jgi:hypothetical protein